MTRAALALLVLALWPGVARAHDRSVSYLRVVVRGSEATLTLRLRALDQSALDAEGLAPASHLARAVRLETASAPCEPTSFTALEAPTGWSRYEWRARCDAPPAALVARPVPMRSAHVVHARVEWPDSGRSSEHLLGELGRVATLGAADASPVSVASWVGVGVEHILTGLDHVVFLAMLLLLGGTVRETAAVVTGFTLGHSVTLSAAALEVVRVDPAPIEALIGLSVALVAVENVWLTREARDRATPFVACALPVGAAAITGELAYAGIALFGACHLALVGRSARPVAWRAGIAAVFGLLHGFGFAGALAEGGLPAGSAIQALLGFNIGVELGQLALVALAWPVLAWLARDESRRVPAVQLASAIGVAAGTFWFVTRAFG